MKMIKLYAAFTPGKSLTYPLRIDKAGRVNLSMEFLKEHSIEQPRYAVILISEDGKRIDLYISAEAIEPANFILSKHKSHTNDLSVQCTQLHRMLDNDKTICFKVDYIGADYYNNKRVTLLKFTQEGIVGNRLDKEAKLKDEVDREISKERKDIGRPRGSYIHKQPLKDPKTSEKKTGAVNNTEFPSTPGRQPWIRCVGCGTFQKKFKKDMYWELKNEEHHIGICSDCGGSDMKREKYYTKIKELESKPA